MGFFSKFVQKPTDFQSEMIYFDRFGSADLKRDDDYVNGVLFLTGHVLEWRSNQKGYGDLKFYRNKISNVTVGDDELCIFYSDQEFVFRVEDVDSWSNLVS